MSIAQERILGLKSSLEGPINICPKVKRYEDIGILKLLTELLIINRFNQ